MHGAGGVTGRIFVGLAAHLGAEVIATAGPRSSDSVAAAGAAHLVDRHSPDWPGEVRALTGGHGVDVGVNAVPGDAERVLASVRDGGRIATITSDPPASERGIDVTEVYVAPDGPRLAALSDLLGTGVLTLDVGAEFPLERAAEALAYVLRGTNGLAVVLEPGHLGS